MVRRYAPALVLLLCFTCGMPDEEDDAGVTLDAGSGDAGEADAGTTDAGDDAGEVDAGHQEPDAGEADAGQTDSGIADAGMNDAGTTDWGTCTAGGVPGTCMEVSECYGTRTSTAGLCPGPSNIRCCTPRYAVTCDPNEVQQPNAALTPGSPGPGCTLPGMVRVTGFCVDRYEASLLELLPDGGAQPWSPYINPGSRQTLAQSIATAVPQSHINQTQAGAACANAGKRLCTDAEWLRACRGSANTTYPYGNTRQPGVCNDARSQHPAVELYGTNASWIWSHLNSPCFNQLENSLAFTGARAGCVTEEGAFDMMGNLHEWTADPAGTFRGGFYTDTTINGNGCLYVTTAHNVSHYDYSTGFRCCSDAP